LLAGDGINGVVKNGFAGGVAYRHHVCLQQVWEGNAQALRHEPGAGGDEQWAWFTFRAGAVCYCRYCRHDGCVVWPHVVEVAAAHNMENVGGSD